jgi:uncharacterized protein YsxB (DUF464 family)
MIRALFEKENNLFISFKVSGHAGVSVYGQDVCCACVSSAVQTVCNAITDIFKIKAKVNVSENEISLSSSDEVASKLIESLYLQLCLVKEEFPKNIQIELSEV